MQELSLGSPRILSRAEHSISRAQISKNALNVLYGLHKAGYEACLVGGGVRDLLLGATPKDFDIATNASPEQVRATFRNSRLIGRRFRLAHVYYGPEIIEVATYRASHDKAEDDDDARLDGDRILRDNVYGTREEDVIRRDFTINALYYRIEDFALIDHVGALEDIEQRRLRTIGDAEQRYREDPVRMLRAVRLAAKLGLASSPPPRRRCSSWVICSKPCRRRACSMRRSSCCWPAMACAASSCCATIGCWTTCSRSSRRRWNPNASG